MPARRGEGWYTGECFGPARRCLKSPDGKVEPADPREQTWRDRPPLL